MGPVVLFDKSFLQSLTLDESVWFDHFFLPVVCPIFFVETPADLTKQQRAGSSKTPQDEVRILADKSPVMSGAPCVHHMQLSIANLMGHAAPRLGQVPQAGGRPVRSKDGKPGVVFERSREAESFARWQRGMFYEVERDAASSWREMLASLNLPEVAQRMGALGITPQTCKTVSDAYGLAASLVHSQAAPADVGIHFQMRESRLDCLSGSINCRRAFVSQELAAAFKSARRPFGDDYSWHGGNSVSVFEPQVFNQSRTSCPVRCWPVS